MKKILLAISIVSIGFLLIAQDQTDHLSVIYDFEGEDFDYSVQGMVGTNDSLYIISQTPNGQGQLFRIDGDGQGFAIIWEFDEINYAPSSIIGNDTIIYGTTRFSANGGGTIFKYSLKDYSFDFIKDFDSEEAQEVRLRYNTDSVLWLSSQYSFVDEGSIATINKDGSDFEKIYNDMNPGNGQNPVDFIFHNDSIYIACFNGGGNPYPDGTGSEVLSGSIIRIKSDGTGYQNLIKGGDDKGTQPQSLLIREDKLIGLFAYSGSSSTTGGQFFRSNLDGTEYDSLGALKDRALTYLLDTDSLVYGMSFSSIFGVDPFTGEIRIFDDLASDASFGNDIVSNPTELNGFTYLSTQQGGVDGGGSILRWENTAPEVNSDVSRTTQDQTEFDLETLFTDPEGDLITYNLKYDENNLTVKIENNVVIVVQNSDLNQELEIIANDGWTGFNSLVFVISGSNDGGATDPLNIIDTSISGFYPNPVDEKVEFSKEVHDIEVYNMNGKIIFRTDETTTKIDVSFLPRGTYILNYSIGSKNYSERFIKE